MKLVKILKGVVLVASALSAVGCVSTSGMGAKQSQMSNQQWDKEAYGLVYYATDKDSRHRVCYGVENEPRCNDENYVPVLMAVSFGFSDGGRGMYGFARKDDLKDFAGGNSSEGFDCTPRNTSKCFFGKFGIKQSGLADFAGIVSKPGEKSACRWSGLPGAGGVVCESLGFDYRKAKLPLVRNF
jgi:hypothetical protein